MNESIQSTDKIFLECVDHDNNSIQDSPLSEEEFLLKKRYIERINKFIELSNEEFYSKAPQNIK